MGFDEDLERFKDPIGYWYKRLSEFEKQELEQIKNEYTTNLDEYFDTERQYLYERIQYHLTPLAKTIELQNLDNHIRVDLDYNDYYHNILEEYSSLINSEKYLEFAFAYEILDDSSRGLKVLKNILSRNIIKLILEEVEVGERNYFLPMYGNVFKDKRSEKFYLFCVKYWLNKKSKPLTLLSYIYFKFSEKNKIKELKCSKDEDFTIICNQIGYAKWWNVNNIHDHSEGSYKINIRKDTGGVSLKNIQSFPNIDTYHTKYNSLKEDFLKQMHKNT